MALKQIFDAITPDNIKDIDLIRDAMDIFIANLEENSAISVDIKELYNSENQHIQEALINVYLNSLYSVITKAQENKLIAAKLENHDAQLIPLKNQIADILSNEYLTTNKVFKQKLGTKGIIEYSYNLAKYLQDNVVNADDFVLEEVKPFYFRTEGSIYNEVYEYIVKPLSHPIGFTYNYVQVIQESIIDYFGLTASYVFNNIEVRVLDGTYHVFTADLDDTNVKADFLTRVNFLTENLFTEQEYYDLVTVHLGHVPYDLKFNNIEGATEKVIYFTEGTILKQTANPINVYYRSLADENADNNTYEEYWETQASLYIDYDQTLNIDYGDTLEWDIITDFGTETYDITSEVVDVFSALFINDNGYYLYTTDDQYIIPSDNWYLYAYDQ